MQKKFSTPLILVAVVAFIVGALLAGHVIKGTPKNNTQVVSVPPLPASFPDVNNQSAYNSFLNTKAIDPTQSVPIGSSQNNSPFNTAGQ